MEKKSIESDKMLVLKQYISMKTVFFLASFVLIFTLNISIQWFNSADAETDDIEFFADTEEYQWADSVDFLHHEGIIEGYEDGTFRPNQGINRAEFTK